MPKEAIHCGAVDCVVPLDSIAQKIMKYATDA
jgi:chemotaxis response regulator CheB